MNNLEIFFLKESDKSVLPDKSVECGYCCSAEAL